MSRVLVVEDDRAILRGLVDNLEDEGHEVLTATDGEEGLRRLREDEPAVVILDVMLPRLSGLDVCRRARHEGLRVPILMLTARGEEMDRVMGLDLGADDYMTKPFSLPELLARVRALLRRGLPPSDAPASVAFGDVAVDFESFEVVRGGGAVSLAPKEFAVLRSLVSREGKVVRRHELLREVWGYDDVDRLPTTRTVDTHIATLRSKLEADPSAPRHLQTVHGVGYKFVP